MKMMRNKGALAYILAAFTFLIIIAILFSIDYAEQKTQEQRNRMDMQSRFGVVRAELESAINSRLSLTRGLAAYVSYHPQIGIEDFELFARGLSTQTSGIISIQLARNSVISHVYPIKGNEAVLGLDLINDLPEEQRFGLKKALNSSSGFLAGPVTLIQGGIALIHRLPVYYAMNDEGATAGDYWGLATIIISWEKILEDSELYTLDEKYLIALKGKDGLGEDGEIIHGDQAVFEQEPVKLEITLPSGKWIIAALPLGGWPLQINYVLLIIGGLLASLSAWSVWFLMRQPEKLKAEIQKATSDLRASEEKYRTLVGSSPNGIINLDADGRIGFVNNHACRLLGADSEESLLGRNIADLLPAEKTEVLLTSVREVMQTLKTSYSEHTLNTQSGKRIIWEIITPLRNSEGKADSVLVISHDITRLKQAEAELDVYRHHLEKLVEERTNELSETNEKLEREIQERKQHECEKREMEARLRQQQKLESLGTLASGVAHEINNPIQIIMNYAEILKESINNDSREATYLHQITSESMRISDIVRNLLAFARQDHEDFIPQKIAAIIDNTLALTRNRLNKNQIKLNVSIPDNLPQVICNKQQIMQVLMNLINNAVEALNHRYGGYDENKILSIYCSRINQDGNEMLRTVIEDHGEGIPQGIIERIFDPFFTTKSRAEGTGLGLWVSQGIAVEHSGALTVESTIGEVTRFILDLPLKPKMEIMQ